MNKRLDGWARSVLLIDQVGDHRPFHFPEIRGASAKVGIVRLFLVSCVPGKDLLPSSGRVQVLLLNPGLDLLEDCRVREDHSLGVEDIQIPRLQGGSQTVNAVVKRRNGFGDRCAEFFLFPRDVRGGLDSISWYRRDDGVQQNRTTDRNPR